MLSKNPTSILNLIYGTNPKGKHGYVYSFFPLCIPSVWVAILELIGFRGILSSLELIHILVFLLTVLRTLLREIETVLAEYQALCEAQATHERDKTLHITAADETFFGELLMLVMMDLSSGYLLLEEIADDGTFDTWWEKTKPRLEAADIEIVLKY